MAQDVKRGHKTNASKCYYNGGKVPVGLKVVEAERIKKVDGKEVIKKKYDYALKHGGEDFSDVFENEVKNITGYDNTHFVYSDMRYVLGGG